MPQLQTVQTVNPQGSVNLTTGTAIGGQINIHSNDSGFLDEQQHTKNILNSFNKGMGQLGEMIMTGTGVYLNASKAVEEKRSSNMREAIKDEVMDLPENKSRAAVDKQRRDKRDIQRGLDKYKEDMAKSPPFNPNTAGISQVDPKALAMKESYAKDNVDSLGAMDFIAGGSEAFGKADNILTVAAKGIAEIITVAGYINVDFEDVKTVMKNSGVAIMGSGS